MLRRSKTSKPQALSSLFRPDMPIGDLLFQEDAPELNEPERVALQLKIEKLAVDDNSLSLDRIKMFIPGRVMHLSKEATIRNRGGLVVKSRIYAPYWIENRTELNEVVISPHMLLNHFPNFNQEVIRQTLASVWRDKI